MLKSIKVRDYMTRHPVTFRPDMDLFTAINRLLEHGLAGAPVLDAEGQLVGILSEADCLRAILAGAYFDDAHGAVGSFMTVVPDTIDADADIIKAAEGFLLDQRQRLPVLEEGRLVGMLSRHDVLRAVKEFAQHEKGKSND
ncbi:CBS domain-containing protein [Pseudomonas sp. OF001]|jgi:CBS domain-containing protein|uniref:CBS domain-containing protein n=1 Tax=unclassified Pseudomonas TaxID=196821 RepID=UPI00191A4654|nr:MULTISPECIES: CBS domain-containing protein [unclassified Pseudomonas]WPP45496.1 CBS domain-containing protein [Pseudomonas sp. AN-1]CAD5375742.1 CBS domain-containing protein [Pseudomonas sp. OF001]